MQGTFWRVKSEETHKAAHEALDELFARSKHGYEMKLRELGKSRTSEQNALLHAAIRDIVTFLKKGGRNYTEEHMKLYLCGDYFGWERIGLYALPVRTSTSNLSIEEFCAFLLHIETRCSENGWPFVVPAHKSYEQYREAAK